MPSVAGIYDRDGRMLAGNHGRTLFGMAHGTDIRITGNRADGVGNALALGG